MNKNAVTDDDWQSRTDLLLGKDAADRIRNSNVFVAGLGGVGGIAAEMLVRAGVGKITIADGDVFEATNRNRQIGALCSTVGRGKAEVMQERLQDINPELKIRPVQEYLKDEGMAEVLTREKYDCVLDAIDSLSPKLYLTVYCVKNGIPLVSCMGSGARLDPEQVRCADISKTEHCPLARAMRRRLHKHGITSGYWAIYSPEEPPEGSVVPLEAGEVPNKRSVTGTISYMPAIFGCHCAAAVLRLLQAEKTEA